MRNFVLVVFLAGCLVSFLIAGHQSPASAAPGDTSVVSLSRSGKTGANASRALDISDRGDYILFAPTGNTTSILDYTVTDSTTPTPYTGSSTITVTVTNAAGLHQTIESSGSGVTITFAGRPDYNYVVERSSDLSNWTPVQTYNAPHAGVWTFTETPPYSPAYYRTKQSNTLE